LLHKIKFIPTLFRLFGYRLLSRFHYNRAIKKRGNIPYCSISEARPKADVNKQKECPRNRRHFHFYFPIYI